MNSQIEYQWFVQSGSSPPVQSACRSRLKLDCDNEEARELAYVQFPQKFVWKEVKESDEVRNKLIKYNKQCLRQRGMSSGKFFMFTLGWVSCNI